MPYGAKKNPAGRLRAGGASGFEAGYLAGVEAAAGAGLAAFFVLLWCFLFLAVVVFAGGLLLAGGLAAGVWANVSGMLATAKAIVASKFVLISFPFLWRALICPAHNSMLR